MFHYKALEELKQEIAAENLSVPFGDEAVLREPGDRRQQNHCQPDRNSADGGL